MSNRLVICCIALSASCSTASAQSSSYAIAHRFHIDGDGGWDYCTMDEAGGRLFVSHGSMVQVLDVKSGKVAGVIPDTKGVHGIALAPDLNKGFVSDGRDSTVTIFDLQSLAVLSRIVVTGANPDAILYEPLSHRVFTFNGRSKNATVIDARTNGVVGTIALDGKPEFAVSDASGMVFVNIEDKSELCAIDPVAMAVKHTWSVAPGEEPSGLAIDAATHRLFSVCSNKRMVILDAQSGAVITTLPIGDRVDGVAFDAGLKRAYSSNGDGTMTVVQEENDHAFSVLTTVQTQKGARTIALDSKTHHVYLPTAEFGPPPTPTKDNPRPRPSITPGSFVVLDVAP